MGYTVNITEVQSNISISQTTSPDLAVSTTEYPVSLNYNSVSVTGPKGDTGNTGPQGTTGDTGVGVSTATVTGGNLIVTLTDATQVDAGYVVGPQGAQGIQGIKGDTGNTGATGATGVGVSTASASTGNLLVTLTDASVIDAGYVIGATGPQGVKGDIGNTGPTGATGVGITTANVTAGNLIVTLSNTSVINAGSVIGPTGATGTAASLTLGNVATGAPGTSVIITNSGNSSNAIYNFTIPQGNVGATGPQGAQGIQGNIGPQGNVGNVGVGITTANVTAGSLLITLSNTAVINAGTVVGPQGSTGATGSDGGLAYRFSTVTTSNVSPGTGFLNFNTNNPSTTTQIILSNQTSTFYPSLVANAYINTWNDSTSANLGYVTVSGLITGLVSGTPTNFGVLDVYRLTAINQQSGYVVANVVPVSVNSIGYSIATSVSGNLFVSFDRVGDKGDTGSQGATGPTGPQGNIGLTGNAATITVGTTTTGNAGTNASVTNSGTSSAAVFNFTIPRGATGATGATGPQGNIGLTGNTGPAGADGVSVTNASASTGNLLITLSNAAVINTGYVIGATGATGPKGDTGNTGPAGTNGTNGADGISVSSATVNAGNLEITLSNAAVINAGYVLGPQGPTGNIGATGSAGADGVSVTNANITAGNLLITLSNATVIDAGTVTSTGIANIVEDTTPQLGGNLDVNGFGIAGSLDIISTAGELVPTLKIKNTVPGPGNVSQINIVSDDEIWGWAIGTPSSNWDQSVVPFFNPSDLYIVGAPGYASGNAYIQNITTFGAAINATTGISFDGLATTFNGAYSELTGTPSLANVATSGDYNDLSNKPTIPAPYGDSNVAAYTGNITAKVNGYSIGYLEMPQVASGNVTLALTDSGKHYYSTSGAPTTISVPTNANVAFPIGTVVTVVNQGTGNILIDKTTTNLYTGGNATSASRTLTSFGVATILKVATDTWFINGVGVV